MLAWCVSPLAPPRPNNANRSQVIAPRVKVTADPAVPFTRPVHWAFVPYTSRAFIEPLKAPVISVLLMKMVAPEAVLSRPRPLRSAVPSERNGSTNGFLSELLDSAQTLSKLAILTDWMAANAPKALAESPTVPVPTSI